MGYSIAFRAEGWVECLVLGERERWVGCGASEAEAFMHALRQMFPSAAARALLERHVADTAQPRPTAPPTEAADALPPAAPSAPAAETAPAIETVPAVETVETAPAIIETAPAIIETAPAIVETAPVVETAPAIVETVPAAETAPAEALPADDGWADAAALDPPPRDPPTLFEQVVTELTALLESIGGASEDGPDVDAMLRIAQQLRWLRGTGVDEARWALATGRLREAATALGERGEPVSEVLSPRHRPPLPWAMIITGVNGADERQKARHALRASLREAAGNRQSLLSWLTHASEIFMLSEFATVIAAAPQQRAAVEAAAADHPDRRVRRKLRDLVRRLGATR